MREDWQLMRPRTRKLVVASIVVISLMAVALVWTILRNVNAEPVSFEPIEETALIQEDPLEALAPDTAILPAPKSLDRNILERHFAAIGGVKRLASINSLLVMGDIAFPNGEVLSFVIAKKRGQRIRVSTTRGNSTIVMVVTPEDAWRSVRQNGKLTVIEDLSEANRENMLNSSYVVSELFLAMNNSWTVEYLGQQAFNYEMAHCYEVKLDQGHFIRFYIDPETFLDIGREERTFDEDGTLNVTRLFTSEHMDISGLKVPSKTESYVNGELVQTFTATDVELNPGILDSSFTRPTPPTSPEE
jgi:hypothetical protein